eukprot:gene10263-11316_t
MAEARWKDFEQKVKAKREVNKRKGTVKSAKRELVDSITVQRLSSDVSGKAQKFSRIGPREFVSYPHGDLTLEGIKRACEEHFSSTLNREVECDVLAGEQGPSCKTLAQVPNLKLIHVRFVKSKSIADCSFSLSSLPQKLPTANILKKRPEQQARKTPETSWEMNSTVTTSGMPPSKKVCPVSLSVTAMMKLGKVVHDNNKTASIWSFNVSSMAWTAPRPIELSVQDTSFARGGFREVFKAKIATAGFGDNEWVVKKYLPEKFGFGL